MAKINIHDKFPSKWLSAEDIQNMGGEVVVTVADPALSDELVKSMNSEQMEEKWALRFRTPRGQKPMKPLLLNKVNLTTCVALLGDDDDNWPGKQLKIGVDMVQVGSQIKPGVRIRAWEPTPTVTKSTRRSQPQPPPEEQADDSQDKELF